MSSRVDGEMMAQSKGGVSVKTRLYYNSRIVVEWTQDRVGCRIDGGARKNGEL